MSRLRWQFVMFKRQLGWVGLLGLAGLLYGASYYFTTVVPAQNSLIVVRQALLETQSVQLASNSQTATTMLSPSERLQNFDRNFPNAESINITWEKLSKLIEKSGLMVDRSIYETSPERRAGLLRYHLNIPVKSAYPQIRDFLAEVVQTTPNVGLENINFKRESVDGALVDANISLVIYVRAQ